MPRSRGTRPQAPSPAAVSRTAVSRTAHPDGTVRYLRIGDLELESGALLPDVILGYETWGTLNADRSNAVLIEHALTGDTHVTRGASEEPGWWEQLAGPGAPVDTDRYFVVSINILGGCYGSTGTLDAGARRQALGLTVPARHAAGHRPRPKPGSPTPWVSGAGTPCSAVPWAGRAPWSGPSATRTGSGAAL